MPNRFSLPELPPVFADLQKKVSDLVAAGPAADLQQNLRQALDAALQKMDLVTREEFEQQQQLLALAQQKLLTLETQLAQLQAAPSAPGEEPLKAHRPSGQ